MPASNAPETPRQRMIGLMYIILLCMLALNVSSDVLGGFELVDDSLTISTQNSGAHRTMRFTMKFEENYKANPEKTKEWYDLAQDLKRRSDQTNSTTILIALKWAVVREADGEKCRHTQHTEEGKTLTQQPPCDAATHRA